MNNIVVLGDGLLGTEICKQTNWDCVSRKQNNFDINNINCFNELIEYKTIVNCIANTNTYSNNKEDFWNTNYKAIYHLILFCNLWDIKLIHISSDFIYANNTLTPSEIDVPVHAENWYSLTKLLADNLIELLSKNFLICRCTHKPYPFPYSKVFIDRIGNFDYTPKIAQLIIELIKKNASGIYNVGTEKKTMYDLIKNDNPNIECILTPNNCPKNTTMNINKLIKFINS